jgi:hypothetical protein
MMLKKRPQRKRLLKRAQYFKVYEWFTLRLDKAPRKLKKKRGNRYCKEWLQSVGDEIHKRLNPGQMVKDIVMYGTSIMDSEGNRIDPREMIPSEILIEEKP